MQRSYIIKESPSVVGNLPDFKTNYADIYRKNYQLSTMIFFFMVTNYGDDIKPKR